MVIIPTSQEAQELSQPKVMQQEHGRQTLEQIKHALQCRTFQND